MSSESTPYPHGALLQAPLAGESMREYSGLVVFAEAGTDLALGQLVDRDPADTNVVRPVPASPSPYWYAGICIGVRQWDLNNYWAAPLEGEIAVIAVPTCMAYVLLQDELPAGSVLAPGQTTAGTVQEWGEDEPYAGVLVEGGSAGARALAYMRPLDPVSVDPGPIGQYAFTTVDDQPNPSMMWQTEDLMTGQADSATGIFSVWFHFATHPDDENWLLRVSTTNDFNVRVQIGSSEEEGILLKLRNSGGTLVLHVETEVVPLADGWYHLLCSWDISAGKTFADNVHIYLNDTDIKPESAEVFTDSETIDWGHGTSNWRYSFNGIATGENESCTGPYYLAIGQYLDFSDEANRRKFIGSNGRPVPIGQDGSEPTGTSPTLYFDNPIDTYHENRGTAGDFQHDDLIACADPASTGTLGDVELPAITAVHTNSAGLAQTVANLGLADTMYCTCFFWIYPFTDTDLYDICRSDVDGGSQRPTFRLWHEMVTTNKWLRGQTASATDVFPTISTWFFRTPQNSFLPMPFTVNAWNSVLFSIKEFEEPDSTPYIYINDVLMTNNALVRGNDPLGLTRNAGGDWFSFFQDTLHFPSSVSDFYVSTIWIDFSHYLDLSVEANRRLFIDADKRPVDLGADGSLPLGVAPEIYLDNPYTTYNVNLGSGGDFRFVSGGVMDVNGFLPAPTHPSYGVLA